MKQYIVALYLCLIPVSLILAQETIIKDLNTVKEGEGKVTIYQEECLDGLIGSKVPIASTASENEVQSGSNVGENNTDKSHTSTKSPSGYIQAKGYKIQIFSGNDQKRSKNEAYSKREQVKSVFPEIEVSITYNSPVWRARAGNYKTYEEAYRAMKEMRDAFPHFGKEMQIVETAVKLPIY